MAKEELASLWWAKATLLACGNSVCVRSVPSIATLSTWTVYFFMYQRPYFFFPLHSQTANTLPLI